MSVEFPMLDPVPEFGEWCTHKGAEALKAKIESYWEERGESVQVWIEQKAFHPAIRGSRFDVRSNLCDGLPRPASVEDRRAA